MKNKLITIIISLIFVNCNGLDLFNKFKSGFKSDIFTSFPDLNISKNYHIITTFAAAYDVIGFSGVNIMYQYNKQTFEQELENVTKNTILNYNNEKCVLLIYNEVPRVYCDTDTIYCPIYDMYYNDEYLNVEKDIKLSDSLEYYVFAFKEGWFYKDDTYLNRDVSDSRFRKYTYKHGFSNGAIVDREKLRIIYWVLIW